MENPEQLLEPFHGFEPSSEHPLQQPGNMESVPYSPETVSVPTQGTDAAQSGQTPSPLRLRDSGTDRFKTVRRE